MPTQVLLSGRHGGSLAVRALVGTQTRLAHKWCSETKRQRVPRDEPATLDATAAPAPDFIRAGSGWIMELWSLFNRGSAGAGCHGYLVLTHGHNLLLFFLFLFCFHTVIKVASMTAPNKTDVGFQTRNFCILEDLIAYGKCPLPNIQAFVSLMKKQLDRWYRGEPGGIAWCQSSLSQPFDLRKLRGAARGEEERATLVLLVTGLS